MRWRLPVTISLLFFLSAAACAQRAGQAFGAGWPWLAERMEHYKVPGVSVAVVNEGKIAWARGYGVLEAGSPARVTPETLFQAASISKPVAALAVLRLVEEGKLSLDEDVNGKLVSWRVPENGFTRMGTISLRRILSHTAGLTVHGFRGYAEGEAAPTLLQLLDGKPPANSDPIRVDIPPGTKFRYSGGGFCVLQQLVEDVTKRPFAETMRTLVLEPLGMKHSTCRQPLPAELAPSAAVGHRHDGKPLPGKWHTYPEVAAAGLWTTPSDLARVVILIQEVYAGRPGRLVSRSTVREMLANQAERCGLGIMLEGRGKSSRFHHGGSNQGFRCFLVGYRSTGQGAVVMTNGDGGGHLMTEILDAIAREYRWPDYRKP